MAVKSIVRTLSLVTIIAISAIAVPNFSLAVAEPYRIVGFGDSLMAGYELAPGDGFTDQLEAALVARGFDVRVENAGVSGDTTSGGLARLDWSVGDDVDLVILELGANDALRGIPPEITRKNLDEMIRRLRERDVEILLAGMVSPPNMGDAFAREFNAIYGELAERHGVALFPFFLDGVAADSALLLADGMHPNAEGVARMVDNMLPQVIDIMDEGTE